MKYVIAAIVAFFVILFGVLFITRGGNDSTATNSDDKKVVLSEYAEQSDAQVQYIIDGPINAPELHRAIRITVTPSIRKMDVVQGYEGKVIQTDSFPNSQASFRQFLSAINREGFTKSRDASKDFMAVCPTSNRYVYRLFDGDTQEMELWSASCTTGSFAGSVGDVRSLFQAQIPGYSRLTNSVNFSLFYTPIQ